MVKHALVFAIGILVTPFQAMAMPAFHLFTEADAGSGVSLTQLWSYDSLADLKALNNSSNVNTSGNPFNSGSPSGPQFFHVYKMTPFCQ